MKLTARDRWLLALLPALLVLIVNLFWSWLPLHRQASLLEAELAEARASAPASALPQLDVQELERLRALDLKPSTAAARIPALSWTGLGESLERSGLRWVGERAGERGARVLAIEGGYLPLLEWLEGLALDPLAPRPQRVECLESSVPGPALRWSVVLP